MILRSPFRSYRIRRKAKYPEKTWHKFFIIWPRRMEDDKTLRCFEYVGRYLRYYDYSVHASLLIYKREYSSLSGLATKKLLNE